MRICIDFDGTVVERDGRLHGDTVTPLKLRLHALKALRALRRAGHVLVLQSSRANLSLRSDPMLDPLIASGAVVFDRAQWQASAKVHEDRYRQMVQFVGLKLPDLFHAIDDGRQGKVVADLYIDDCGVRLGHGGLGAMDWEKVAETWGRRP